MAGGPVPGCGHSLAGALQISEHPEGPHFFWGGALGTALQHAPPSRFPRHAPANSCHLSTASASSPHHKCTPPPITSASQRTLLSTPPPPPYTPDARKFAAPATIGSRNRRFRGFGRCSELQWAGALGGKLMGGGGGVEGPRGPTRRFGNLLPLTTSGPASEVLECIPPPPPPTSAFGTLVNRPAVSPTCNPLPSQAESCGLAVRGHSRSST